MDASATSNIVLTHIGSSLTVVGAIQALKSWLGSTAWYKKIAAWAPRAASAIGAIAVHAGISWTWQHQVAGGWIFNATIPPLSVLLLSLYHIAVQYLYQETAYQGFSGIQSMQQNTALQQEILALLKQLPGAPAAAPAAPPAAAGAAK